MEGFINQVQMKKAKLSNLENQVLEYILAHTTEVSEMTIEELSSKLYLSSATVSRTAKRLGFKGFQELKYAIIQYQQQEKNHYVQTHLSDSFIQKCNTIIAQISQSFEYLDETIIDEIIQMMNQANVIELFGVGGSLPMGMDVARKLLALGKVANARTDWDELRAVSKALTPQDVAILISLSGETIHIIEYATNLVQQQVPIIAIVGSPNSTLESIATYTLKTIVQPIYFGEIDVSSRASLAGVLDLLIIQYASQLAN